MMKSVKRLTASGITIAIYIDLMYLTQFLSLGQIRIRVADCIYALCHVYPFLIVPLGVANFIGYLFFGGFGPVDMIGWTLVGTITAAGVRIIRILQLNKWFTVIPVIMIPGFFAPVWLSYLLHIPYIILALGILAGQSVPAVAGVVLLKKIVRFAPKF